MIADVLGVWDDAAPRPVDGSVPANPRVQLRLTLGASYTLRLTVVTRGGVALDFGRDPEVSLIWTVKKTTNEWSPTLKKTGTPVPSRGRNCADFSLVPNDTKFLQPGVYVYDIWVTFLGERNPVIPTSPFLLEPAATLP